MTFQQLTGSAPCPCGSGQDYAHCCGPLIAAEKPAASAEALMRSRYSAFVLGDSAYLGSSWASETRPASLTLEPVDWKGLKILDAGPGQDDCEAYVRFIAYFRAGEHAAGLLEKSRFIREDGHWVYFDGVLEMNNVITRKQACPCGSGKKFKHCCAETYFQE